MQIQIQISAYNIGILGGIFQSRSVERVGGEGKYFVTAERGRWILNEMNLLNAIILLCYYWCENLALSRYGGELNLAFIGVC